MRTFFVDAGAVQKSYVTLRGSDARQIKNVLRLRPGDAVRLFDGQGYEYEAVVEDLRTGGVDVRIHRRSVAATESPVKITVAQALLKEKKMDVLLRQLCELGISGWMPFFSERSVPRPDPGRMGGRIRRWEKIARESFKQCRRARLPEIGAVATFEQVLASALPWELRLIFWEDEAAALEAVLASRPRPTVERILIVLGPEGGFSRNEIEKAKTAGFEPAGLGPRILRAETAALAACTLMQFLFGDLGQKNVDKEPGI